MLQVVIIGKRIDRNVNLRNFLASGSCEVRSFYTDGRAAESAALHEYQKNYYRETGNLLSPGEYGCIKSHMAAYQYAISKNSPVLVLEDDATPKHFTTWEQIALLTHEYLNDGAIHLGAQNGLPTKIPVSSLHLLRLPPNFLIWRTAAYLISARAAESLLYFQQKNTHRADDWRVFTRRCKLDLKYIDLFDHPPEPDKLMQSERAESNADVMNLLKRRAYSFFVNKNTDLLFKPHHLQSFEQTPSTILQDHSQSE